MKEQEHKREVERLWQEKLVVYKAQRDLEVEEKRVTVQVEQQKQDVVNVEKDRLLREHAAVLGQFNPKAATQYGASNFRQQ